MSVSLTYIVTDEQHRGWIETRNRLACYKWHIRGDYIAYGKEHNHPLKEKK